MIKKRGYGQGLLVAAAAVLLCVGLWTSWRYTIGVWRSDPDIFVTVQLWKGVHEFGPGFVRTWIYTQDNWLFSLVPFTALFYELFGATLKTAVMPGWLIFVGSVALTAALIWRLVGWRAALATACVLVFGGLSALGAAGYLSYPISHNLSMAWALLTLVLALDAVQRQAYAPALVAAATVFINVASDPWAAVAIAAPLIVASAGLAVLHRRARLGRVAAALAVSSAVALLLAHTQLFGLLSFLPKSHFKLADLATMRLNVGWAQRSLGHIFNIFPGADPTAVAPRLISAAVAVLAVVAAMTATVLGLLRASPGRQLVGATAVLSIAGIMVIYVAGSFPPALGVGRFFPQVYYLGALLVALVAADHWRRWRWPLKAGVVGYAVLFVLAGLLSAPALWMQPQQPGENPAAVELAEALEARGLSYGYGVFWGTHSLVMDTITQGRVTIRPVSFMSGRVRQRPAQTSSLWYAPQAEPSGDPRRFLVIVNDGEECPDVAACVEIAERQFGPASERFHHGDAVVLVWPGPVAPLIDKAN
jgi:hypothetical protein